MKREYKVIDSREGWKHTKRRCVNKETGVKFSTIEFIVPEEYANKPYWANELTALFFDALKNKEKYKKLEKLLNEIKKEL